MRIISQILGSDGIFQRKIIRWENPGDLTFPKVRFLMGKKKREKQELKDGIVREKNSLGRCQRGEDQEIAGKIPSGAKILG